jgi:hypothetical protein
MEKMKRGQLIARMERLSAEWKAQFDDPPEGLPLCWTVDADGVLRLDGRTVCRAADVTAGETYDVELLDLSLKDGRSARVKIVWPYAGQPSFSVAVMSA